MCIDVEPDKRAIDSNVREDWKGFEKTYEFFCRLRSRLEAATRSSVHFTWFLRMDPQIGHTYGSAAWAVTRYSRIINEIQAAGDEVGLHIHPWRWDKTSQIWIQDFADQEWIDHCVRLGFKTFRQSLKRQCLSFRFGDHWLNDATLHLVEKLGARFDLTVEPGYKGGVPPDHFVGSLPDYTTIPQQPYRPSRADFKKPGLLDRRSLWIVPVSAGSIHWTSLSPIRRLTTYSWVILRHQNISTGLITANPNPIPVNDLAEAGETVLSWTSQGTTEVEVRFDAPDGPLVSRTGPSGKATTGKWVSNGKVFYLQDVSGDLPLTSANTLSTVKVNVTPFEQPTFNTPDTGGKYMTLNLAFNSLMVGRIMDTLLSVLRNPYLALVVRSDVTIRPNEQVNLEENFDDILSHPLVEQFVFETPMEAITRVG